ncbi:MAG: PEGA domain-containing protein [Deltaproteobacteria bacterium]|nr:PEGA domain-containing protein [Deltaproteobacteria bacterium]
MRAWFPMVVVLLLACVARADDRPLAVFAVAGAGDAAARTRLEERVRMAAGRYATVQPAEVTAQALRSATTLGLSCDLALVECARRMGALAGAGRVVVGALEHDDTLALGLIAVDASGPAPVTQRLRLPAPGVARDAAVERLVMMLLAPERLLGRLLLDVAPVGARIVVDDVFRGPAPLRAPLTLAAGPHRIDVAATGWLSSQREVALEAGGEARVRIELERDPDAPVPVAGDERTVDDDDDDDASPGSRVAVAVFPFAASGVPERVARVMSEALAAELQRRDGLIVLSPAEVQGALAGARPACRSDARCLAELARALEVDAFVAGRAEANARLWTLTLERHDSASGAALFGAHTAALADDRTSPLTTMPDLASELFPEHEVADGAAPLDLRAFSSALAPAPLQPWMFWTVAGIGGALALTTTGAGALALVSSDPVDAGRAGAAFAIGAGATVVVLGAAGVVGVLVDWQGP